MTRITRASRRLVVLLALVTAFLLLGGPALPHVTANPNTAPADAYFRTAFRVGHGCDGSPTTEIRMQIPSGLQSVRPEVVAGWDVEVVIGELEEPYESHGETVTEGPVEIVWSGGNLPDEHFQEFGLSMKLPDAPGETFYFPFVQICEEGESAWIEIPDTVEEWNDLDSPAPYITLTGADEEPAEAEPVSDETAGSDDAADADTATADTDDAELASDDSAGGGGGDGLAITALVVGLASLATGGVALARSRR